jgi:DNA polymerase-3 subunit epsilon
MLKKIFPFLRNKPMLSEADGLRLARWEELKHADLTLPFAQSRCVVVDVETSGLNPNRDHLLAIGAIAVSNGSVQLADSFEIVLQQETASTHDNILIHGISGSCQFGGVPPQEALLRFLEFLGNAPLVAFHARFDQTMIDRATTNYLGVRPKQPWLDLAHILPALYPEENRRSLDDWLARFAITNSVRHNALSDATATAQLFLIAQAKCLEKNILHFESLLDMEQSYLLRASE